MNRVNQPQKDIRVKRDKVNIKISLNNDISEQEVDILWFKLFSLLDKEKDNEH